MIYDWELCRWMEEEKYSFPRDRPECTQSTIVSLGIELEIKVVSKLSQRLLEVLHSFPVLLQSFQLQSMLGNDWPWSWNIPPIWLASIIHSIRSEVPLHLQMPLPLKANSEHTLCSDFHHSQLLHSFKFYVKVMETNWASDVADCILSALWLNRRFQFSLPARLLNPLKQKYSDEENQLLL